MSNVLITIVLVFCTFASIVALLNTQKALRDLSKIKAKLGIKDEKKLSFFDDDIDIN